MCSERSEKFTMQKAKGMLLRKLPRRWLTLTVIEREQVGREKPDLVVTEGTHW